MLSRSRRDAIDIENWSFFMTRLKALQFIPGFIYDLDVNIDRKESNSTRYWKISLYFDPNFIKKKKLQD